MAPLIVIINFWFFVVFHIEAIYIYIEYLYATQRTYNNKMREQIANCIHIIISSFWYFANLEYSYD